METKSKKKSLKQIKKKISDDKKSKERKTYKIIKESGTGFLGKVFLVEDNDNKKYAMKIEKHVLDYSTLDSGNSVWRNVEFSNTMCKLYPNHFMKVYDIWVENNCKLTLKTNNRKKINKERTEQLKKLKNSTYCVCTIYTYVEFILSNIINNLTKSQYYDIFIQCLYIMYLCSKNGYLHRDWKLDNIGLVKTNNKYINIFNNDIPTHGYLVILLDYGSVINKKYKLQDFENKIIKKNKTDLFFMFNNPNFNMIFNFKEFENKYNVDTFTTYGISNKLKLELKNYLPEINTNNNELLSEIIYKILFYSDFEKRIIDKKFNEEVSKEFKPIKPELLLPTEAIIILIKNIYDIEKCISLLIKLPK